MDGQQFDQITRSLFGELSRRQSLAVFTAGLASVGRPWPGWDGGAAKRGPTVEGTDRTCRNKPAISNKRCPQSGCTRNTSCLCAKTVNNNKRCVKFLPTPICPTRHECKRNKNCGPGQVCMKIGGCCPGPNFNVCIPLCG